MTKQQYIDYWVDAAQYDWKGVEDAFNSENYLHSLFWAHLVLEKLAKAHWVKNNQENIPPKVHNVVWILDEANVNLGDENTSFLEHFNAFQLSGRYPDYTNDVYKTCDKEFTHEQLQKVKEVRRCLLETL